MGHGDHPGARSGARRRGARPGGRPRTVRAGAIGAGTRAARRSAGPDPGLPRRPRRARVLRRRPGRDPGRRVQRVAPPGAGAARAGFAGALLVDAGTHQVGGALEVLACGASEVVVGLETSSRPSPTSTPSSAVSARLASSSASTCGWASPILHPAMQDAAGAHPDADGPGGAGGRRAGVRSAAGARCRSGGNRWWGGSRAAGGAAPSLPATVRLLAGGGVLTRRDLERMRDAGCDGALVATALHTGRIGATAELAPARVSRGERLAVGRRLAVVLLDLDLQQRQVAVPARAQLVAHPALPGTGPASRPCCSGSGAARSRAWGRRRSARRSSPPRAGRPLPG